MNDAKSTITLLACCCIVLTIAPSASADFVGVTSVLPDDPDTADLCTAGNGQFVPPGGLTVCNVYAVFDDPADRLQSAGNADLQVYNGANPDVFFQHLIQEFANIVRSPLCSEFDRFPDLICDSHITIGLKCSTVPPGDNTGSMIDHDEFRFNGHLVGCWFAIPYADGASQGDADNWPDLQVLMLQSSVEVGLSMSGVFTPFWLNAAGDILWEENVPVECAAECGSCPTDTDGDGDTDAADLAVLLGSWGPVDSSDCLDADGDGTIGAFDLAQLLGNWGQCP